jgi:uncharacterized protein (DUF2141 family)
MIKYACCLLVFLFLMPCGASADTLLVTVKGIKVGQGNIRVAVFDKAHRTGFSEGKYFKGAEVAASKKEITVKIPNLKPGEYAIAIIQDLNKNQKLDRNRLKIPTEPYGFSGKWKRGAASYDQAKIDTKVVGSAVTITLK